MLKFQHNARQQVRFEAERSCEQAQCQFVDPYSEKVMLNPHKPHH